MRRESAINRSKRVNAIERARRMTAEERLLACVHLSQEIAEFHRAGQRHRAEDGRKKPA